MRTAFPIIFLFCLTAMSCEEENDAEIIIKTGRDCGWCGGSDSLTLTKVNNHYEFRNSCPEPPSKEEYKRANRTQWNELLAALDWDTFKQVNVNTCAQCADGCDTWVVIENKNETHQIRFTENSPEIDPIREFVEKLDALHEEFRPD
ncbi:MAG TPA: hypothetical protein VFZ52_02975 [Chryseolinea sp.]